MLFLKASYWVHTLQTKEGTVSLLK